MSLMPRRSGDPMVRRWESRSGPTEADLILEALAKHYPDSNQEAEQERMRQLEESRKKATVSSPEKKGGEEE